MPEGNVAVDWRRVGQHAVIVQKALAAERADRSALVADAIVEYGQPFVDTLVLFAHNPAFVDAVGIVNAEALPALLEEAGPMLSGWIVGERLTARADEAERRVLAARELFSRASHDTVLARMVAVAILRLPDAHPARDTAYATQALREHLERSRIEGDVHEQAISAYYLLRHELETPPRAAELIDEIHELLPSLDLKLRRDFLRAAHDYAVVQAGVAVSGRRHAEQQVWLRRAELLYGEAVASGEPELSSVAMRAWRLDMSGHEREAADAYAEVVDGGDPRKNSVQYAAVSEATLRSITRDYRLVRDRLAPFMPLLTERYLTAVAEEDVQDGARLLGRAAVMLALAHARLEDPEAALRTIDLAKSMRLRYRGALAEHPARSRVLELERALRVAAPAEGLRSVPIGGDISASVPLRARLSEEYRRARPGLPAALLESPSVAEIIDALWPGEAALVIGLGSDATMLALVGPGQGQSRLMLIDDWPAHRWERVLTASGWLDAVAHAPGSDGPAALRRVLTDLQEVIGARIDELAEAPGLDRFALVPHRWLHLIPWWAVPRFAECEISVFASAAEFVRARKKQAIRSGGAWLVASDPTGDLVISASEVASIASRFGSQMRTNGPGEATVQWLTDNLADATLFHFSGHGMTDPSDADRCALLVSPPGRDTDPFPAWAAGVGSWHDVDEFTRVADVEGVGHLWESSSSRSGMLERRMEQTDGTNWYACYADDRLLRLGRLWTAADILALGPLRSELAFLSACESGLAGQVTDVDEFGGLATALQLAGVRSVVCSMWVVSQDFAAINVDLFYERLLARPPPVDVLAVVREVQTRLRLMGRDEAVDRLDALADAVRARSARAAMALEASRRRIEKDSSQRPFGDPWSWASFYAAGVGTIETQLGGLCYSTT